MALASLRASTRLLCKRQRCDMASLLASPVAAITIAVEALASSLTSHWRHCQRHSGRRCDPFSADSLLRPCNAVAGGGELGACSHFKLPLFPA
jgi:hypothetical protein